VAGYQIHGDGIRELGACHALSGDSEGMAGNLAPYGEKRENEHGTENLPDTRRAGDYPQPAMGDNNCAKYFALGLDMHLDMCLNCL
jgi:hypothetical protein